jgi:hypothetical protein
MAASALRMVRRQGRYDLGASVDEVWVIEDDTSARRCCWTSRSKNQVAIHTSVPDQSGETARWSARGDGSASGLI